MALLMDWNGGGEQGYVRGDDQGRPTSVVCSSGSGSWESGAEYAVEEVLFSPVTQKTVRSNCSEAVFEKLMSLLAKRKLPNGMYFLPEPARKALPQTFSAPLSGWKAIYEEALEGGSRLMLHRLLRYENGALLWVNVNENEVAAVESVVEGLDAQALDAEYLFRFSDAEKQRIAAALVKGADGMKAMRDLFGDALPDLQLMMEETLTYNNWTRREWHVKDSGILHLAITGEGLVEYYYLIEKGDAYLYLKIGK
jgi:hypothetical protein